MIWVDSGTTKKVDSGASVPEEIGLLGNAKLDNAGHVGGGMGVAVKGVPSDDGMGFAEVDNHSGGITEGTKYAIELTAGGLVVDQGKGSIIRSSNGGAIKITGDIGTVDNKEGSEIIGGSTAIYLEHGGKITNGSGSLIKTTGTEGGSCNGSGDCSIFVASNAETPTSIGGELTLVNEGTIVGNVQMIPTAANDVTLWADSSIRGNLDIGTNESASLVLTGGVGTTQLFSEAVSGATTFTNFLTKEGSGAWTIDNGELTHLRSISVNAGTLMVGTGGTVGSIGNTDVAVGGGDLVFDRSDKMIFKGNIKGGTTASGEISSGWLVQSGAGTLVLAGQTMTAGQVKIKSGILQIGDGSTGPVEVGMPDGRIEDNASLVFDIAVGHNMSVDSVISGTGQVTKQGAGVLYMNAANTYTGGITIASGRLESVDAVPGSVSIQRAGSLGGPFVGPGGPNDGGVPSVDGNLSNAGTVSVNERDTAVSGNYVQDATGTLAVGLGNKLTVAGTATLNGGTLKVAGIGYGYTANSHTEILTAKGGVIGKFAKLVKAKGVVFTSTTIGYGANDVYLNTTGLNVTTAAAGDGVVYTPASYGSAMRVQSAFDRLDTKIADGAMDTVSSSFVRNAGAFQRSPDLRAAQTSLDSLSGQLHAASAGMTLRVIDATGRALSDRLARLTDQRGRHRAWMRHLQVGGDMTRSGYANVDYDLNGWLVGTDVSLNRHTLAGFAVSQGRGIEQLTGRFDRNRGRNTAGMAYLAWTGKRWYAHGRVGMGHYHQHMDRMLLLGSSYQGVWTDYDGHYNVAYGESGLHFGMGSMLLTPFVDLEYARVARDGFVEHGAGGFGLKAGSNSISRWQSGVGLKLARRWHFVGARSLGLDARMQWRQTLSANGAVFDASFVGLDAWRPLTGVGLSRHSAVFGLDLNARPSANTNVKLGYEYLTENRGQAGVASARFSLSF